MRDGLAAQEAPTVTEKGEGFLFQKLKQIHCPRRNIFYLDEKLFANFIKNVVKNAGALCRDMFGKLPPLVKT